MASVSDIKIKISTEGGQTSAAEIDGVTKAQTRQANASSSAGRLFAAQSQGLGGVVGIYAGAAATIISITSAFNALAKAARNEEVIKGTDTLAKQIGASGSSIIARLKEITNGQLSVVDSATLANTALSAGFNTTQLEGFASVAAKASKVLGRDLSDSFNRLVKGAAKLEPELLDELGIFTRIEPAVQKYAASVNRSVSSLTEFERRQAFANAAIAEGNQKFGAIDIGGKNAQSSLERLSASFADLTQNATALIANVLAPLAEFFSKTGNLALLFGLVVTVVFSKLKDAIVGGLGAAFSFATNGLDNLVNKFQKAGPAALETFNKGAKEVTTSLTGTGAISGIDTKTARSEGAEIRRLLKDQQISISDAQKGAQLAQNRLANFGPVTTANKQQFDALTNAVEVFNSRLEGTGKGTQIASKGVSGLREGLSSLKDGIAGILGRLGQFAIFVSTVQFLGQLAGFDIIGKIGEQFSKIGEEAAKSREKVDNLTSAILTTNGVTSQYANIIGANKEQQEAAGKAVADYAEQLTKGSMAEIAAGKSKASFFSLERKGATAVAQGAMKIGDSYKAASDIANNATQGYDNLTRSIQNLTEKGTNATAQEKLQLTGLKALKEEVDGVGQANFGLLVTLKASGISLEAARKAIKNLTSETGDSAERTIEFRDIYKTVIGVLKGFGPDVTKLGEAYALTEGSIEQFNDQLSKGANSEKLSQSLVAITTQLVNLKTQYTLTNRGETDLNSKAIQDYERKIELLSQQVGYLKNLEKINKDIQATFSSSIASMDKLQISGAIGKDKNFASTSEEQKTNQLVYLQDLIKMSGNINELEKKGVELQKLKEQNQREGNVEGVKYIDQKIQELGLDAKRIQILRNAEAAEKALVGLVIESTAETTKLLKDQEKASRSIQNQVRLEQVQQELTILENGLTLLKSRQDVETKILDLTNQRVNAETSLANTIASSKQTEIETAIKLIGLQQELLGIESRRVEAGAAASNAKANRKDQQELLAVERKQNELNILGNLASEQQIRDADIAVARKKYEIELSRITREENLVNTKASFDLKAIDLKESQLKREQELNDLKIAAAAKEGADQIILLNQKKEQDDLAYNNRVNQLIDEGKIADKTKEVALLRAEQSRSERSFQLDILDKQIALYALRSQIDDKLLSGLAANLEGEAQILLARQGETPETKRIKELATELAESTKKQFTTNIEGLQRSSAEQRAASNSLYDIEARNADLTRTLKKTLGDEELSFLAKKQGLTNQTYELEIAKIVEATAAKLNSLDADKKVTEGRLGALNSEREIIRSQAAEKLTNLGIERDKAIEIIALAEKKYQLESQGILKFVQLIKGAIETNLNKGVDSFFDAIKNGTLTLKSFKEGVVGVFKDILFEIAKSATKEFLVKPITDAIGAGLGTLLGKEVAGKLTGSATAGLEKGAEASAKTLAGATTGQCGCIGDALSKVAPGAAGGAADAATKAAAEAAAKTGTDAAVKAASQTIETAPAGIYDNISNPVLAGASGYTPAIPNISPFGSLATRGVEQSTIPAFGSQQLTSPAELGAAGITTSMAPAGFQSTFGVPGSFAGGNMYSTGDFNTLTGTYTRGSYGTTGPQTLFPGRNSTTGGEYTPGPSSDLGGGIGDKLSGLGDSIDKTKVNIEGLGTASIDTTGGMQGVIAGSNSLVAAKSTEEVASGTLVLAKEGEKAVTIASEAVEITDNAATTTSAGVTEFFTSMITSASSALTSFIASLGVGSAAGAGTPVATALLSAPLGFGASGGLIRGSNYSTMRRFAAGGGVQMRDSVPALLEPGEFVMKKSSVDSIGRSAMERMNATGKSAGATNIKVQVENQGQPKEAEQGQTQIDGETAIVKLILKDLNSNGPIRRSIRGNM